MTSNSSIHKTNFQSLDNNLNTGVNLQFSLPLVSALEVPENTGSSSTLTFIDASVSNYESLIAGVTPGTEVHVLKSGKDAIAQITETLLSRHDISSLHIISHGSIGSLNFASSSLNAYNIRSYTDKLQIWGSALTENADILLYGCNVAENALGKTFVELMRQVTGADVAASDNLTGTAKLGGDWELEYKTGSIDSEVFQAQTTYDSTLATYTVSNTNDSDAGSLRDAINQANSNPGEDNIIFGSIFNDGISDTIRLSSQLIINDSVTIQGTGQNLLNISGNTNGNGLNDVGDTRIFFINQGIVNINNMALLGGRGQGGNGAKEGGGGGLGAGGAIFINGVTSSGIVPTQVAVSNVLFTDNQAIGGKGGDSRAMAGGGGGGFGGNGGDMSGGGGGFGGAGGLGDSSWSSSGVGGNGGIGGSGGFFGNAGGARGSGTYTVGVPGGDGGNGGYGGGGGGGGSGNGPGGNGGNGGDFGGGGGSGKIVSDNNTPMSGGNGGFAGGGGSSGYSGINRGFRGGNGGFGGGGGVGDISGIGGAFGGNAGISGGGGAGLGGAIFIRSGSLSLTNSTFNRNLATGGSGVQMGQAKGGAIFVYSDATLTTSGLTYTNNSATNASSTPIDNSNTYFLSEVSISASNNAATETPYNESVFRISRKGSSNDLVVNFTPGGNAIRGSDYNLSVGGTTITGNTVLIPNGQSFVDIVVKPLSDGLPESIEDISISLVPNNNNNYLITNAIATVNIVDRPSISITSQDVNAVDSTGNTGTYRISRTDGIGELVVSFMSSGSATRGTDYNFSVAGATITTDNIVIPDGQNFVDVVVTPLIDTQREGIENVTFNLTSLSNTKYSISNANATVNIADVPIVSISAEDTDAVESTPYTNISNTGIFRVSRTDTAGDLKVNLGRSGNAILSNDYNLSVNNSPITGDSVIIPNGKSFVDVVVTPVRDSQSESMESITFNLVADDGYFIGAEEATVNITDTSTIRITALDADAVEATRSTGTFRISRTDSGGNMTFYFYRRGNANTNGGTDYTLSVNGTAITSDRVDMPDGQSFVDIVVTPISDSLLESSETVTLELSSANQVISATVNITDVPVVNITAIDTDAVDSTGNTGTFRISRNDNVGNLVVDFARNDSFNTYIGTDYNLVVDGKNTTSSSVVIQNGRSFVDIVVAPVQDTQVEGRETVTLNLVSDSMYSISNADATVKITDSPIVRVTALDADAVEKTSSRGIFRIERTDSIGELAVNFSMGGIANSNEYNLSVAGKPLTSNSIIMLNGQSFVDVVVTPISDGQLEATETVTLNLTSLSNTSHVIRSASATVNITDIPLVSITAIDADAVDSGKNTGTFRISRNDTIGDLKVGFGRSDNGTNADYTLVVDGRIIGSENSVTISNGQSFVDVVLVPMQDGLSEGTENVTLSVLSNSAYSIGSANATVNITDSPVVRITALDGDAVEATRSTGIFRISRTDNFGNITVNFARSGSASFSYDYNLGTTGKVINGNSIEFLNGESYVDIFVSPLSDSQQEPTETVTLDLIPSGYGYVIDNASATVNITEIPIVNITALDTDAVDTTGNTGAFRISRNDTTSNMTVNFDRSGSAIVGSDYTLVVDGREVTYNSIVIPTGQDFVDVIVVPKLDGQSEGKETVKLSLSNNMSYGAYSIGDASATVSIADFSIVRITAVDTDAVEATRSTATFRIFRTDSVGDATINFKSGGVASSNDYIPSIDGIPVSGNQIVMLDGQSFVDIVVTPVSDSIKEFTENVTLDLVSVSGTANNHVIGVGSAAVNITDVPLVSITAIDADAADSTVNTINTGTFRISRNDTVGNLKVGFGRNGNATSADYVLIIDGRVSSDNSVIIPNGKSFVDVIVQPTRDSQVEGTENITLNLINPDNNYSIGNAIATVNITDLPVLRIAALEGDAVETPLSVGTFRISRTDSTGNITVNLDISGSASINSDYRLSASGKQITSGMLEMLNGQDYVDIIVTPISDTQQEATESVTLGLIHTSNSNYVIENSGATVNITDKTVVSITAIDADAVDSTVNTGTFRISRNNTLGDFRVYFGRSGNASDGADYTLFIGGRPQPINSDIIISDGESFVDVVVVPTQDSQTEGTETVTLSLSGDVYSIGNANATVNIADSSVVRIAALDEDAVETTRSTATFRISRTNNTGEVTANLSFGGAANYNDYTLTVDGKPFSGSGLTMLNGQSFVDVIVTPISDSQAENTETVTLHITSLSGSSINSHTIGIPSATVNITDMPVVSIMAIDASAVDSMRNTGTFRVSRNDTVGDLKVNLARSGNATLNSDYTLLVNGKPTNSDSIIITNGQSFVDVVVIPTLDSQTEGTETVTFNLIPDSLYSIGNTHATVNITDIPVVNIATLDADAVESTLNTGTFRVSRTDSTGNLTVNFSRSGNAAFGIDYTLNIDGKNTNANSITMLNGQSFVDIVVAPTRDSQVESTEAVTLNLTSVSSSSNYVLGSTNATVNITDLPIVNITAIDADATELAGNTGTFRISRNDTTGYLKVDLMRTGNASFSSDYALNVDGRFSYGDSVTFLNGQSFIDVVVLPNIDSSQEGNEVVTLSVAQNNYGISPTNSSATVTIIDAPVVIINPIDVDASETPGNISAFRISRGQTSGNLTVNFTRGGQATSGTDYNLSVDGTVITGNSVVIADGQEFVDVLLTPIDDSQTEVAETAQLQLSTGSYAINTANKTATITIAASDNPPTVNDISKSGNEDTVISFSTSDFNSQFTDIDGENLSKIKITSLPTKGVLKLGGTNVTLNQEIAVAEIANLTFTPDANFNGAVSFTWNGFDGSTYAVSDAAVSITINPTPEWQIVAVEDFTGDGKQDILQRDLETSNYRLWCLNTNNIGETIELPKMDSSWKITSIANFDGNKTQDIFWQTITGENRIWRMDANGVEVVNLPTINPSNVTVQHVGDFEGDGDTDILVRDKINGMIAIWESNATNPNFIRKVVLPYVSDNNTQMKQISDLDGDGDLDILWYNSVNGFVAVWKMQGTSLKSGFELPTVSDTNTKIQLVADFDGDNDMDILWYNGTNGFTAIWEMDGVNLKQGVLLGYVGDANTKIKQIVDFDGDKDLDILWYNDTNGFMAIWEMNGVNLKQGIGLADSGFGNTKIKQIADFDGDNDLDFLWYNDVTGFTAIWEMNGVNFKQGISLGFVNDTNTKISQIADFDSDKDLDIFWHNQTTGFAAIWSMNGVNIGQGIALPAIDTSFKVHVVGDFNGDGKLDVVWYNSTTSVTKVWLTDGGNLLDDVLLPV